MILPSAALRSNDKLFISTAEFELVSFEVIVNGEFTVTVTVDAWPSAANAALIAASISEAM